MLRNLILSHNQITDLPIVDKWSKSLKYLFIQHNELYTFPSAEAAVLVHLDLSYNKLDGVPRSVCKISTLETLVLSGNKDIHVIPVEFGRLTKLTTLKIKELQVWI